MDQARRVVKGLRRLSGCGRYLASLVAMRKLSPVFVTRTLVPLVDDISAHLGRKHREVSGNAGLASEVNLAAVKGHQIKA